VKAARIGILLLCLTCTGWCAQKPDSAEAALRCIERGYASVKDYKVEIQVSVESPQVHMPNAKAVVYFKRPDKLRVIPKEGFMMMPSYAVMGDPVGFIRKNFSIIGVKSAKLGAEPVYILSMVGKTMQSAGKFEIVVEKRRGLIVSGSANDGASKLTAKWEYKQSDGKFWMPIKITVKMEGLVAPQAFDPKEMKMNPPKTGTGTAIVTFTNYRINRGIPDSIFVEKKQGDGRRDLKPVG